MGHRVMNRLTIIHNSKSIKVPLCENTYNKNVLKLNMLKRKINLK